MRIFASPMYLPEEKLVPAVRELSRCVDGFHIDLMDGEFVPTVLGAERLPELRVATSLPLWFHLMVARPDRFFKELSPFQSGDIVSVHYESFMGQEGRGLPALIAVLQDISSLGAVPSVAISPETPVAFCAGFVAHVEQILLMSVVPGRVGQRMLPSTAGRLRELVGLRQVSGCSFAIGMDGGINAKALQSLLPLVPDDSAVSTAIFADDDWCLAVERLRELRKA